MKKIWLLSFAFFPIASFAQITPTETVTTYDTVAIRDPNAYNVVDMQIRYKSTGRMYRTGRLLNGKKQGLWRTYFDNGTLNRVEEYNLDFYDGIILIFDADGSLEREQYIRNGALEGIMHTYSHGLLKTEEFYTKGVLNGWRSVFSKDGNLQEEGLWRNGKRDSLNRWCYEGGSPYIEYVYKNGIIDGPSKQYYESGRLKAEGNYVANAEEGPWKEYSQSGKVAAEGNYKAGKKSGAWKIYADDGSLLKTQSWDNGTMTKETPSKK